MLCWGDDFYGQLGYGRDSYIAYAPVQVIGLTSGMTAISGGVAHACAVHAGGTLACSGTNAEGQLGTGVPDLHRTPVGVVGLASGVQSVAAGAAYACAIASGGGANNTASGTDATVSGGYTNMLHLPLVQR